MGWEKQLQTILRAGNRVEESMVNRGVASFLKYHRRVCMRNLVLLNIASIGSLAVFVYSGFLAVQDVLATGILDVFSLIFSDFAVVMNHWDSFIYSIIELLPALSLAGFFAGLFWLMLTSYYSLRTWNSIRNKNVL